MHKLIISALCAVASTFALAQAPATPTMETPNAKHLMVDSTATGPLVLLKTDLGDITLRLYDDTPLHRDNFLKLAAEGKYDGVLFHRVIKDFMVQTGDLNSKDSTNTVPLGAGDIGYTIPAEFRYPKHFHKYGALAAARSGDEVNPTKASSGSQFYIVTGDVASPNMLKRMEQSVTNKALQSRFQQLAYQHMDQIRSLQAAKDTAALDSLQKVLIAQTEAEVQPFVMPQEIIDVYTTIGGTPHLDTQYTVFGEVIDGMEVVEAIQSRPTSRSDRPLEDVRVISARPIKEDGTPLELSK